MTAALPRAAYMPATIDGPNWVGWPPSVAVCTASSRSGSSTTHRALAIGLPLPGRATRSFVRSFDASAKKPVTRWTRAHRRGVLCGSTSAGAGWEETPREKFPPRFFFHAATQTSTARQRVASTRKREATSRQLTEGPLKLTVEAAGRSGTLSISLSIFWQFFGIDPTDASLCSSKRSYSGFLIGRCGTEKQGSIDS